MYKCSSGALGDYLERGYITNADLATARPAMGTVVWKWTHRE
jgi:hypothetical protein